MANIDSELLMDEWSWELGRAKPHPQKNELGSSDSANWTSLEVQPFQVCGVEFAVPKIRRSQQSFHCCCKTVLGTWGPIMLQYCVNVFCVTLWIFLFSGHFPTYCRTLQLMLKSNVLIPMQ